MYIQLQNNQITAMSEWQFPGSIYTDKKVIRAWDGKLYFSGEEPAFVDDRSYQEKRADDYPPYQDYLDALVKMHSEDENLVAEGQEQLNKYYADCLKVKQKYPKA